MGAFITIDVHHAPALGEMCRPLSDVNVPVLGQGNFRRLRCMPTDVLSERHPFLRRDQWLRVRLSADGQTHTCRLATPLSGPCRDARTCRDIYYRWLK